MYKIEVTNRFKQSIKKVLPDLVLIYKIEKEKLVLLLFDIETHSNLF